METGLLIGLLLGLVAFLLIVLFFSSYKKAPPDTAFFITGLGKKPKVLIGQAGFKIPFLQRLDKVPLNIMQVDIKTQQAVPTKEFINIQVDGVANIKVSADIVKLELAAQIFLKEQLDGIAKIVKQVLDGNMREIIGQMRITDLVHNRDEFAAKVRESAAKDMDRMGIEIISFTVQNFTDGNDVLTNLGIDQIVAIKKDAAISRAQSERDIEIAQNIAKEESNKARITAEELIAVQNNSLALKQAELKLKSDTKKAEADTAYEIQKQIRLAEVNTAIINAEIAKQERQAELGKTTVEIKEQELNATVRKTADAQKYAAEQQALANQITRNKSVEAHKYEEEKHAEIVKIQAEANYIAVEKAAQAELIKAENAAKAKIAEANANKEAKLAEATGIAAIGQAEAEAIDKKAEAMKKMEEAAVLDLVLKSKVLPDIVNAMTQPLAAAMTNIDSITMYGEGNNAKLTEDLTKTQVKLFDGIQDATGIDIKTLLTGLTGGLLGNKLGNKINDLIQENTEETKKK